MIRNNLLKNLKCVQILDTKISYRVHNIIKFKLKTEHDKNCHKIEWCATKRHVRIGENNHIIQNLKFFVSYTMKNIITSTHVTNHCIEQSEYCTNNIQFAYRNQIQALITFMDRNQMSKLSFTVIQNQAATIRLYLLFCFLL